MLKPVEASVRAPIADREDHLLDILTHISEVAGTVARIEDNFASFLRESDRVARELAISLMIVNLDMEFLVRVDSRVTARQVLANQIVLVNIDTALA